MKKKFLAVFSLLLVISLLAVCASASVEDKPGLTLSSPRVTLYDEPVYVTVTLTLPMDCYAIEGNWSVTLGDIENGIKLHALTVGDDKTVGSVVNTVTGHVAWADVNGEDTAEWFKNPIRKLTAIYMIPAGTLPEGTLKGNFNLQFECTVFVGTEKSREEMEESGDWSGLTPVEGTFTYHSLISVTQHACKDENSDHICDDGNCKETVSTCAERVTPVKQQNPTCEAAGVKAYYRCPCGKFYEDDECKKEIADLATWKTGDGAIAATHAWGDPTSYTDNGDGTHTAHYTCGNDATHTKSEGPVAHDFSTGNCVCGAVKPAPAGLKGDIDLDGDVDSDDVTRLLEHVAGIEDLTDPTALTNGEVDGDGQLTSDDVTRILEYVAGIISKL